MISLKNNLWKLKGMRLPIAGVSGPGAGIPYTLGYGGRDHTIRPQLFFRWNQPQPELPREESVEERRTLRTLISQFFLSRRS